MKKQWYFWNPENGKIQHADNFAKAMCDMAIADSKKIWKKEREYMTSLGIVTVLAEAK